MAKAKKETSPFVPVEEQPYPVPENWCWVSIDSINQYKSGSIDPMKSPDCIFELYSVPSSSSNYPEILQGSEIGSTKQAVEKGDVLLCKINPRINRVWSVSQHTEHQLLASSEWIVVRNTAFVPSFLMFYFQTKVFREYMLSNVSGVGGSLMRAQPKFVKEYPIPIAPLAEQQRIVDRIESLLAKLDEAKEKAQAVVDGYEQRKASVLGQAFRGNLTVQWRKEHGIFLDDWNNKELNSVCERIFDGPFGSNLKSKDYVSTGIRVVRLENIKHLWFDDSKQSFITAEKYATIEKHTVYPDDLIMSTFIADNIKIAQLPSGIKFAANKADCIGIRVKKEYSNQFIMYYLSSDAVFYMLFNQIHDSTRPRVNTTQIKKIMVPLPSCEEQQEIVRIVEGVLDKEQQAKETAEAVIGQIETMKKSILARAFRGELGTNDPAEESAAELLKTAMRAE